MSGFFKFLLYCVVTIACAIATFKFKNDYITMSQATNIFNFSTATLVFMLLCYSNSNKLYQKTIQTLYDTQKLPMVKIRVFSFNCAIIAMTVMNGWFFSAIVWLIYTLLFSNACCIIGTENIDKEKDEDESN